MSIGAALIYFTISLLAHLLGVRWLMRSFAWARKRERMLIGACVLLASVPAIARYGTWVWHTHTMTTFFAFSTIEIAAVLAGALFATVLGAVVVAARGLGERGFARVKVPAADPPQPEIGRREAVERISGVVAFGTAGLALGWGAVKRHDFQVDEVVVKVKGWPRALEGYTIAQVSDIHVGTFVGDRELDEGFEHVKRIKPDLVVATGDLVDFVAENVDPLAMRMLQVGARDGAYAILGNHDHYAGPADVVRRAERLGVRVLCNESQRLRIGDGGGFLLVGVDDLQGRRVPEPGYTGPDLGLALRGAAPDLPRILLAHQPWFLDESAGRVALQLSGHTHGGQVPPIGQLLRYARGRFEAMGTTLWVNRGFGVVGPPVRIGSPPEVTKIVIVAA